MGRGRVAALASVLIVAVLLVVGTITRSTSEVVVSVPDAQLVEPLAAVARTYEADRPGIEVRIEVDATEPDVVVTTDLAEMLARVEAGEFAAVVRPLGRTPDGAEPQIVVAAGAAEPELARGFVLFALGPDGAPILRAHGLPAAPPEG